MDKTYRAFVLRRHRVWVKRQEGFTDGPWTDDPIIATRKFTNVFRFLDYGTKFLYEMNRDEPATTVIFRSFLYRFTNRPEPWTWFRDVYGEYPTEQDLRTGTLLRAWRVYRDEYRGKLYGPAYTLYGGLGGHYPEGKLPRILEIAREYLLPRVPAIAAEDLKGRVRTLKEIPACSDFLAMQVATDIGYTEFLPSDENSFIVTGPGSARGLRRLNLPATPAGIRDLREEWLDDLLCPTLWTGHQWREPSLMDVQNTLCEFDKYMRYKTRGHRGVPTPYRAQHPEHRTIVFPSHW